MLDGIFPSLAGETKAGEHTVRFGAANLLGGVYLMRLAAGQIVQTRKALLIKCNTENNHLQKRKNLRVFCQQGIHP